MEIVTTLVKFRCRKDVMMEQSKNAQIFLFNGKEGKTKVFVPKSKLIKQLLIHIINVETINKLKIGDTKNEKRKRHDESM